MRLDLEQLAAGGLSLTLPGPGGRGADARQLGLAPSRGVRGTYRRSARAHHLAAHTEQSLHVDRFDWPFDAGHITLLGRADLERLAIDLRFRGPTRGRVAWRRAVASDLALSLDAGGGIPIALRQLEVERGGLSFLGERALSVVAGRLRVARLELAIDEGRGRVALHDVELERVAVQWGPGGTRVSAAVARAREVVVQQEGRSLHLVGVKLDDLTWSGGRWRLGALRVQTLEGRGEIEGSTGAGPELERSAWDLSLLDRLRGRVDVDATVEVGVPVVGKRRATHALRIGVRDGAINFKKLERSLATLEDALLDFVVDDDALVLERSIPIVGKKDLVRWPLPPDELRLASEERVRVARLPHFVDPSAPKKRRRKKKKRRRRKKPAASEPAPTVALRELRLDNIGVHLDLPGPGRLQLPAGGAVAVGGTRGLRAVRLTGRVRHRPGEQDRGQLELETSALEIGLEALPVGARRLDVAQLSAGAIDRSELVLAGLHPERWRLRARDVRCENLELS